MSENPQAKDCAGSKRRYVRLVSTLLIVILAVGLLVVFRHRANALSDFFWPAKSEALRLSFSPNLDRAREPIIPITGQANRFSQVELFLDGRSIGRTTTFDHEIWSSQGSSVQSNWFQFPQVMLHPGQNSILLRGRLVGGVSGSRDEVEVHQVVEWRPEGDVSPTVYRLPKKTTAQPLHVQGAALPHSAVILSLIVQNTAGEEPKKAASDVSVTADDRGHFEGDLSFPAAGKYFVFAHRSVDEPIPHYGYDPRHLSPDSPVVRFAPNSSSRVLLSVNYDQITVDVQETLPKDDPAAVDLLSGHNSLAEFVHDEFDLHVNGEDVAFSFRNAVPQISINENQATIRARASIDRSSIFPVRSGSLEISRGYQRDYPVQGPNDSLEVVINDYTTQAYLPVPTLIQYPSAIWTGARELVDWDQTVRLSLSFNPTKNPRSLFRFVSLSPYQLFGYKISSVLSLLTCALYAIPILWFLFLLNEHTYLPWIDRDYLKALKRISKFLLALTLLPGIERSAFVLAGLIFQRWRPALTGFAQVNSSNNPVLLFLGTLVVCFLSAIVLTIVKTLIRHHTVRVWLAELRTGVFLASLIQVLLDGFYLAVLFVTRDLSESLIPGTLMTLCFLALIAFCVRRLAKQWLPVRIPFQYVFLSLILLLLWAYPAHRNIYSLDRPEFSTWDVTYSNLSYFFGMAQDLMPYVLLVGIVQILKAADRREAELHPFIYAIALLLFSCYVIGTTTNWFIVPIPFLLALSLYPALLAAPPTRVDLLNKLKPRVISGRRWLLDRVFELSFSERLMSSMDQMEKKIVSGDLAIEEFLARRAKLENFAAGVREAAHDLSEEMETSELALSLGPYETNWLNGWHAVKRGLLISLPFLVFYLMTFVLKQIRLDSPFVFLWTSLRIFTFVLDWAAYAFFFGYFFNQLQGESGLKKGLKVALVVIACLSPVWLISGVSAVELSATFLRAGQIFLFFTVLGVWAFDYHTFRSTLREQFSWKKFAQFGDMPSFTAVASVLLTSAGVAFSSVLKGRFLELVTHLVSGIFPEIPGASR